jgi:hypothetical protein
MCSCTQGAKERLQCCRGLVVDSEIGLSTKIGNTTLFIDKLVG